MLTCKVTLSIENTFKRKIDPVVNGIPDSQSSPHQKNKSKLPTVLRVVHVGMRKYQNGNLAADIIVNELGIHGTID